MSLVIDREAKIGEPQYGHASQFEFHVTGSSESCFRFQFDAWTRQPPGVAAGVTARKAAFVDQQVCVGKAFQLTGFSADADIVDQKARVVDDSGVILKVRRRSAARDQQSVLSRS